MCTPPPIHVGAHDPEQVLAYHGQWRKKITAAMLLQADVVLTSYSMLRFIVEETDRIEWHRVVFDEAHYMKSATTITTILCKRMVAKHRWCLTGMGLVCCGVGEVVVVTLPTAPSCRALAAPSRPCRMPLAWLPLAPPLPRYSSYIG